MKTKIVRIGNSQGIRLPKILLHQIGAGNEIEMEVEKDRIILKPIRMRRNGWFEAFSKMAANKDDQLFDGDSNVNLSSWDDDEWIWEDQ